MINKTDVILQLELVLLPGFEDDDLQLELDGLLGFAVDVVFSSSGMCSSPLPVTQRTMGSCPCTKHPLSLINQAGATLLPELNSDSPSSRSGHSAGWTGSLALL